MLTQGWKISDPAHEKWGLRRWALLGMDENNQEITNKTIRIFDLLSIVNVNALINYDN